MMGSEGYKLYLLERTFTFYWTEDFFTELVPWLPGLLGGLWFKFIIAQQLGTKKHVYTWEDS